MSIELTTAQEEDRATFRAFVDREVVPQADRCDRDEAIPDELMKTLAARGYLGLALPKENGGHGRDMTTYGLLSEEIGRGCSSLRSILTVHGMVAHTILRWGSCRQKAAWLPRMAAGQVLGAFALSEPAAGSDPEAVVTTATPSSDSYVLNGRKKWITGGQIAGLFLVVAHVDGKPAAFLLERTSPGLSIEPIKGMLGVRASMLAELRMDRCRIPKDHLLGQIGFGLSHVAFCALDHGRYGVAWGCVGIGQACIEASMRYAGTRRQFGAYLKEHQLIRRMLTDMVTNVRAARLLCHQAGHYRDVGDPRTVIDTLIAKYFASTMAHRAADDTVQIHGANGCGSDYPAQRYLRDAKIMEIIEGSTQIQQLTIAKYEYDDQYQYQYDDQYQGG